MELSNLIICRKDVLAVSDAESQSNHETGSNKRKTQKHKTKFVRNVQLSTITIDRIVPYCYRDKCKRAHHHKNISKNSYEYKDTLAEEVFNDKTNEYHNTNNALSGDSPITIESSNSDTYDDISSKGFKTESSDSDELEELIKSTRQRMKQDNVLNKTSTESTIQIDHENILSDCEEDNCSLHSMGTVVLHNKDPTSSTQSTPEQLNDANVTDNTKRDMDTILMCSNHNDNMMIEQNVPSPFSQESGTLSPLYEISGKIFMEHYLNTIN